MWGRGDGSQLVKIVTGPCPTPWAGAHLLAQVRLGDAEGIALLGEVLQSHGFGGHCGGALLEGGEEGEGGAAGIWRESR